MKKKSTTFKLILALFLIVAGTAVKAQVNNLTDLAPAAGVFCPGVPVTLTANSAGATSYTWFRYDGKTTTGTATTVTGTTAALSDLPANPGYYTYVSTGINADGCTSTVSDPIVVYVLPGITAAITSSTGGSSTSYCKNNVPTGPAAVVLTATGSSAQTVTETFGYNYQWYKGTNAITGATGATYTLNSTDDAALGSFNYTVQLTYKVKPACTAATSNPIGVTVNDVPGKPTIIITP